MDPLSRSLLSLALRLLPRQVRRAEADRLEGRLRSLSPPRRVAAAAAVLLTAPALRWRLLREMGGARVPLPCWVGVHLSRRYRPNVEDPSIIALRCRVCGRERDPRQYGQGSGDGVAYGNVYVSGGG